jgi:hypothetical protein
MLNKSFQSGSNGNFIVYTHKDGSKSYHRVDCNKKEYQEKILENYVSLGKFAKKKLEELNGKE